MEVQPLSPLTVSPALPLQNPAVRAKIGGKLDELLCAHGTRMLGNRSLLDSLVTAALKMLSEASQDARTFGKRMLWELKRLLDASGASLEALVNSRAEPRIRQMVLQMLQKEAGPPPAPRPMTRMLPTRGAATPATAPATVLEEGGPRGPGRLTR